MWWEKEQESSLWGRDSLETAVRALGVFGGWQRRGWWGMCAPDQLWITQEEEEEEEDGCGAPASLSTCADKALL